MKYKVQAKNDALSQLEADAKMNDFNLIEKYRTYKIGERIISIEQQHELINDKNNTINAWKKLYYLKQKLANIEDYYEMGQLEYYSQKIKLLEAQPIDLDAIMKLKEFEVISSFSIQKFNINNNHKNRSLCLLM